MSWEMCHDPFGEAVAEMKTFKGSASRVRARMELSRVHPRFMIIMFECRSRQFFHESNASSLAGLWLGA